MAIANATAYSHAKEYLVLYIANSATEQSGTKVVTFKEHANK